MDRKLFIDGAWVEAASGQRQEIADPATWVTCLGFAERLECRAAGINVNDTTDLQAPFGSWKLPGLGRELGREGILAYREARHIRMRLRPLA